MKLSPSLHFRSATSLSTMCVALRSTCCIAIALGLLSVTGCGGSAQTGAIVASAALLGAGAAAQGATHSSLKVTVDVYDPGYVLSPDGDAGPSRAAAVEGFRLDHELAVQKALRDAPDPVDHPTLAAYISVRNALKPIIDRIGQQVVALEKYNANLAAAEKKWREDGGEANVTGADALRAVRKGFQVRIDDGKNANQLFNEFAAAVDKAKAAQLEGGALTEASGVLARLRTTFELAASRPEPSFGQEALDLLKTRLQSATAAAVKGMNEKPDQAKLVAIIANSGKEVDATDADRLMDVLNASREVAVQLASPKRKQPLKTFDKVFENFGFVGLTTERLLQLDSPADLRAAISHYFAPLAKQTTDQRGATITYGAFTNSFNLGSIANEAFQMIYTRGDEIAQMSRPENERKWHEVTHAISDGGQGNHNTVIYFENLATPVIKSSSFDPTKFVVANGALYRRAFAVAAQVFGLPVNSGTSPTLADINIPSLRRSVVTNKDQSDKVQKAIVGVMKITLDEQAAVKAAGAGDQAPDADAIARVRKKLEDAATQLEKLSADGT